MRLEEIPLEVREAVGGALTAEGLETFWEHRHTHLGNKSPKDLWERGEKQPLLEFIATARENGDNM